MLVYIDDREDEELHNNQEYVYEYDDNYGYDYGGEEDFLKESYEDETNYEINEDYYLVL